MSNRGLKVAVIGGGSSYTPELIEGLLSRAARLPIREVWLVDIPEGREKVTSVAGLAGRMAARLGVPLAVRTAIGNRREALDGADFVVSQARVGLLEGRILDERIPMRHGCMGQETVGAGGFASALRTIPMMLALSDEMRTFCPEAFLINFSNPSGVVTEALLKHAAVKVIGLCNNPINMEKEVADLFSLSPADIRIDFVGCNHLLWGNRVWISGRDVTSEAIEKMIQAAEVSTSSTRWPAALLRSLGALPCHYHRYYYLQAECWSELQERAAAGLPTRGEEVKEIEGKLFHKYNDPALDRKPPELSLRGGALYSEAAVRLMDAIHNDAGDVQCVNTRNDGALADLRPDCAVEVSAVIDAAGARPLVVGPLRPPIRGLLALMKAVEALTVQAAVAGDREAALQALTLNPLVPSASAAQRILDDILRENAAYLPQFFRH